MYAAKARAALQQFDEGDDQAALGDQRATQPFQKIRLHRLDAGSGFLSQGFDAGRDGGDIRLGRKVGVEEGDMLFGQLLGEAALGQALDEAMGVEGDGRSHARIKATPSTRDRTIVNR